MKILELCNINKNFGDLPVLRNVHFTMEGGQSVAIVGASGTGKTTMLKVLVNQDIKLPGYKPITKTSSSAS